MGTTSISVGTATAAPGHTVTGAIRVAELNDSSRIEIPVAVVNGALAGPTIWIQNGVHGDEYVGMGAIQWLLRALDPMKLRGTVILVPMLNIQAYRNRSRMAPQDTRDMNRAYPGRPLERAMHIQAHTEVVLNITFSLLRQHAQYAIDCHDGSAIATMSAYAAYNEGPTEWEEKSRQLAVVSGMSVIWKTKVEFVESKFPGSLRYELAKHQIPAVTFEVGGEGRLVRSEVARMLQGLKNCLCHLGMIDGAIEKNGPQYFVSNAVWLRASVGGTFWAEAKPLQRVKRGETVATITDLLGRDKERLTAPHDGIVVGIRSAATVHSGEYCANVSEIDRVGN